MPSATLSDSSGRPSSTASWAWALTCKLESHLSHQLAAHGAAHEQVWEAASLILLYNIYVVQYVGTARIAIEQPSPLGPPDQPTGRTSRASKLARQRTTTHAPWAH